MTIYSVRVKYIIYSIYVWPRYDVLIDYRYHLIYRYALVVMSERLADLYKVH